MDWSTPIDLYCERTDPSFWAEPVNALTNLVFLIAAAVALIHWRRAGAAASGRAPASWRARDWPALALIAVTALIGIGSFVFHTVATTGAVLLDVVPISVFIYGYLFLALLRLVKLSMVVSLLIIAAFAALSYAVADLLPSSTLNGSHAYLPALLATLVVGGRLWAHTSGRIILAAGGIFAVSLVFRTIDTAVCEAFPLGTHFIWHSLNGVVLYLLLRAAISGRPKQGRLALDAPE